jgi:hypothetical protein
MINQYKFALFIINCIISMDKQQFCHSDADIAFYYSEGLLHSLSKDTYWECSGVNWKGVTTEQVLYFR